MESLTGPDFKTEALKEICEYRDNILKFVHETFSVAEGAVKKVLHRDAAVVDFIKNLEESTLLLKICRERLAVVDGHLPTEPFPNQNVLLPTQNQPMIVWMIVFFFSFFFFIANSTISHNLLFFRMSFPNWLLNLHRQQSSLKFQ